MEIANSKKGLLMGILMGLVAVMLAIAGNPKNMAICLACFIRDMSGAMKFHTTPVVQYFRPEIVGMVLGAFIMSIFSKEYKATGGSSPVIRFFSGMAMMIGALVFLGCPTRMILRMASGDMSSYIGLVGFLAGIATGSFFIKKGYSLEKRVEIKKENGYIFPIVMAVLLVLSAVTTGLFAVSAKGPGSIHAPLILSLLGGLIVGAISQKFRVCFTGAFRNIILLKNFEVFSVIFGMFITVMIYNVVTGQFKFVPYGPVAHAEALWNILGLYVVGFAGILLGGCPLRQVILAGQGSSDSVMIVIGMFVGAAAAHNFKLAAGPAAKATGTTPAAIGGPGINGKIMVIVCIIYLFYVAITGLKKEKTE